MSEVGPEDIVISMIIQISLLAFMVKMKFTSTLIVIIFLGEEDTINTKLRVSSFIITFIKDGFSTSQLL